MGIGHVMLHPNLGTWNAVDVGIAATMWMLMMAAMMLPSVMPWLLALSKGSGGHAGPGLRVGEFLFGYLLIWSAYSVVAAMVQWQLHDRAMLSALGAIVSPPLGGALLLVAGVFQWTPVKNACLEHCRSPLGFFLTSWRDGRWGALRMGVTHGFVCVGCCWALMALSFVAGVMNLTWMVFITLFVFVDHAVLQSSWLSRSAGVALGAWGIWLIATSLAASCIPYPAS